MLVARRRREHPLLRRVALALVGVRVVLAIAAIPLAPLLYRRHFVVLVLLRPTKDVLLAAGFAIRRGDVALVPVLVAAVPLLVLGVWLFFYLGREYGAQLRTHPLPGLGGRLLPRDRVSRLATVLRRRGLKLVFLGRLAAFPSTLVAAAAGTSDMRPPSFLGADAAGAAVSVVEFLGAGYLLGDAYRAAGPWLTAIGVAIVLAAAALFGRYLRALR